MAELFMPVLSHFNNENHWSARIGRLHYWITPVIPEREDKDTIPEGSVLRVQVWEGPWAREFSVIEEEKDFPLSQEGIDSIPAYLEAWHKTVEARPQRSLEENIARKKAPEEET